MGNVTNQERLRSVSSSSVVVLNLDFGTRKGDLFHAFDRLGDIERLHIVRKSNGVSERIAYIKFFDSKDAQFALMMDGRRVNGRRVTVQIAQPNCWEDQITPNYLENRQFGADYTDRHGRTWSRSVSTRRRTKKYSRSSSPRTERSRGHSVSRSRSRSRSRSKSHSKSRSRGRRSRSNKNTKCVSTERKKKSSRRAESVPRTEDGHRKDDNKDDVKQIKIEPVSSASEDRSHSLSRESTSKRKQRREKQKKCRKKRKHRKERKHRKHKKDPNKKKRSKKKKKNRRKSQKSSDERDSDSSNADSKFATKKDETRIKPDNVTRKFDIHGPRIESDDCKPRRTQKLLTISRSPSLSLSKEQGRESVVESVDSVRNDFESDMDW